MSSQPNPPARKETWLTKIGQSLVLIAFASLAIVPLMMYGCAGESARWRAAAAFNLYEEGQTDLAIEKMQEIADSPAADPRLQLQLAEKFANNHRGAEGLKICERLMEQTESPSLKRDIRLVRVECLQSLGEFKTALEEYKGTLKKESNRGIRILNNLAYHRALAGAELGAASTDIQKAINKQELTPVRSKELEELLVFNFDKKSQVPLSMRTRTLLAAAIASRELDCREQVLPVLSRFIDQYEQNLNSIERAVTASVYEQIKETFPLTAAQTQAAATQNRTVRWLMIQELAFLRTARAILFQDQDQITDCDRDRQRIKQLGLDADAIAAQMPRGLDCLIIFNEATMTLDTRGFVRYRGAVRPSQLVQAKFDLDLAVLAAELNQKSFDSSMRNSTQEIGDVRLARRGAKRTFAVLLYHRMLINTSMQNVQEAEQDALRVRELKRELGYDPDARLF